MPRVLIVDDDAMIREVIREYCEYEDYQVREAASGVEAIEICRKEDFDVIVMDLMMPHMDGFTAYENIKKIKNIPALVLSARGEEYDKLYGFSLGIDDYVVKPFSPKELIARLGVIISRNKNVDKEPVGLEKKILEYGGMRIEPNSYCVYLNGKKIKGMTLREFDLLYFMASHPGIVFSRDQLLNNIWGYDYVGDGRTIDTHIKMLRHSLGEYREYIATARGVGYKFEVD